MSLHLVTEGTLELFWGHQPNEETLWNGEFASCLEHDAYLDYSQLQCWYCVQHGSEQAADYDLVTNVVQQLKENKTRAEILARLSAEKADSIPESVEFNERCVDLSARLLVMLKFGRLQNEAGPRRYLHWSKGSLRDFIEDYFGHKPELSCDRVRLPKAFNAWSLENVGGVKVKFTDNLADHLLLIDDDTTVLVFHYASFLELQRHNSLLPDGLAEETLSSLALLFPQSEYGHSQRTNRTKRDWLRRKCQAHKEESQCAVDKRLIRCGTLQADGRQIEKFHFWRDRLVILKQTYDDAMPRTLSQWWLDRRNGVQWYTFWVAILVFVVTTILGIVQCIEGALQVYMTYQPSRT